MMCVERKTEELVDETNSIPTFFSKGQKMILTRLGLDPRTSSVLRKRDNQLRHPAVNVTMTLQMALQLNKYSQ